METSTLEQDENPKSFIEMPEWFQRIVTTYKPMIENRMNDLVARRRELAAEYGADDVNNVGIDLAIQQYGLRALYREQNEHEAELLRQSQPSTSCNYERPAKKLKISDEESIMSDAMHATFAQKGISIPNTR